MGKKRDGTYNWRQRPKMSPAAAKEQLNKRLLQVDTTDADAATDLVTQSIQIARVRVEMIRQLLRVDQLLHGWSQWDTWWGIEIRGRLHKTRPASDPVDGWCWCQGWYERWGRPSLSRWSFHWHAHLQGQPQKGAPSNTYSHKPPPQIKYRQWCFSK